MRERNSTMDFTTKLIHQVCSSSNVKLFTLDFLSKKLLSNDDGGTDACKVTELKPGCLRVVGSDFDWIMTFHADNVWDLIDKIRCLSNLVGTPGVQVLVGVCPEMRAAITEYGGENLRNTVKETGAPETDCLLGILYGLTSTLYTLTSRGVYHNAIKEESICIVPTSDGPKVTLVGFGLCTSMKALCNGYEECELCYDEIQWMAPEVMEGQVSSESTEVYSMGCLMRRVVTEDFLTTFPDIGTWMTQAVSHCSFHRPSLFQLLQLLTSAIMEGIPNKKRQREDTDASNKRMKKPHLSAYSHF